MKGMLTRRMVARTSFAFMLLWVPLPVWKTTSGNSSTSFPEITYTRVIGWTPMARQLCAHTSSAAF